MITTGSLASFPSHSYNCVCVHACVYVCVCVMRMPEFYTLSSFQAYNTITLTVVTMPSPELCCLVTGSLYSYSAIFDDLHAWFRSMLSDEEEEEDN